MNKETCESVEDEEEDEEEEEEEVEEEDALDNKRKRIRGEQKKKLNGTKSYKLGLLSSHFSHCCAEALLRKVHKAVPTFL
jgi:hypothetical protein